MHFGDLDQLPSAQKGTAAFATPTVARVAARDGFAAAAARGEFDSSRAEARHAFAGDWRAEFSLLFTHL